jgi:hypothetical protein
MRRRAVIDRRPSARAALERADSLLKLVEGGEIERSSGNLIAARAWERVGDLKRAHSATKRVALQVTPPLFTATYLRERARLAAAVGDNEDAIRQYRRYIKMRENPDPSLVADRDAAAKELARLEKLTGGR